jgi:hypothetical protein
VILLLAAALLSGAAAPTVALLPLENVSGDERAGADVAAVLARALTARGYVVARGEAVEAVLEAERVRYLDSLPQGVRARLRAELGAGLLLTGAVYTYAEGPSAMLAFSARMVETSGAVRWASVFAFTARDTEGILGTGRAGNLDALLRELAARVQRDLPGPGEPAPLRPRGKPFHLGGPRSFAAAALGDVETRRVAVLPPEGFVTDPRAGAIVAHLLAIRLRDAGLEVVEAADLRAAMRAEGVRSFRAMEAGPLAKIGERVGASLFLSGSVYAWRDSSAQGSGSPEASVELTLVDVLRGRVLWTGQHARRGGDYALLLQRRTVTSAVALADRVVGEMLEGLRAGGRPARANASRER